MSNLKSQISNPKWIVLVCILVAAAVLRLGWPGIGEFKYDEAMISRRAIDLVHKGLWPASTISSIPGIPQPPLKALLLAIPYGVTRNPAAAVAFQGALGVLTVAGTYWLARRYFNERVALITAGLLAFAPWTIFYDRKLWSQNVPILTLVMMAGLYAFIIERKSKAIVATFVALGLLIGFYLGNAILAGIVIVALLLYPRSLLVAGPGDRSSRKLLWLGVGFLGLIITLIPYLVEFTSGRADLSLASQSTSGGGGRVFMPFEQMRFAAHVATGYQFHALAGDQFQVYYQALPIPDLGGILDYGTLWLIMLSMVYLIIRSLWAVAHRQAPTAYPDAPQGAHYVLLALWIVVPIAAWTASGLAPWPHRYIMMFPAQHLALAVMLVDALDWVGARRKSLKPVAVALVATWIIALSAWQTVEYLGMLSFVSTHPITGGYGRPVRELWSAAQKARQLAGLERLPVVVHTDGADPEHEQGPAQFDAVLGDLHLYLLGDPDLEVVPTGKYVWVDDHGDGSYAVELRTPPAPVETAGLARLANGIDLVAASAGEPRPGQPVLIALTWRIWNTSPGRPDYGFTVQLYDDEDRRWGQFDGQFVRSAYWSPGDTVIASVMIPVEANAPAGARYHLLVAMYAYLPEAQQAVDILDIAGNPAGQSITIPLD